MPSEDDLRSALAHGVASVYPDVDHELELVLGRATRRAVTRRTSYAALVAAAVALALVLTGIDWRPRAAEPAPVTPVPVHDLYPNVGRYASPTDIEPGLWNVDFLPDRWPHRMEAAVDVPPGWGQDDRFALATGPGGRPATRRIDFFTGRDATLGWCLPAGIGTDPTTLEVAQALGNVAAAPASTPDPVTVDDHPGYLVELGESSTGRVSPCQDRRSNLYPVPGLLELCRGSTTLAWVLDVDGRVASIYASYGPATTRAQIDELVRMVETADISTTP